MSRKRTLYRRALTAAAIAVALPLSGCGTDAPDDTKPDKKAGFADGSAQEIVHAGFAAMKHAGAARVRGNTVDDGKPLKFDVRTNGKGRCYGTLRSGGSTATFISTNGASYLKGDRRFWVENAGDDAEQTMAFLGSRWAKLAHSDEFADLCSVAKGISQFGGEIEHADDMGDATVSEVHSFGGHQVVEVAGKTAEGERASVTVSVDEPHFILRLVSQTPKDPGTITFSFDAPAKIDLPGPGEFVDLR